MKVFFFAVLWITFAAFAVHEARHQHHKPQSAPAVAHQPARHVDHFLDVEDAHKTVHRIADKTLVGDGGMCTATAVGPQTILTASHCEAATDKLVVDGNIDNDVRIVKIIRDDYDHSLIELRGIRFTDTSSVDFFPSYHQGDRVYMWGNPAALPDIYRQGYFTGFQKRDDTHGGQIKAALWDYQGYKGDSGSGLFNEQGVVIAVTTYMYVEDDGFKLMGTFPFNFTKTQINEALDYCLESC